MPYLWFFVVIGLVRGHETGFGRLSGDTVPESYVLRVVPDFEAAIPSFAGQVDIAIRVKTTTPTITLHSKDLVLDAVKVTDVDTDRVIDGTTWDYVNVREQVQILMQGYVLANRKYTVSIRFNGRLRDDAKGFFKTFYTTNSNDKKQVLKYTNTSFSTRLYRKLTG